MNEERGRLHRLRAWDSNILIIPTYHPAAIIYRRELEKIFQEDIKKVAELVSPDASVDKRLDHFFDY